MSMDLNPINPSDDAPRYPKDHPYGAGEIIPGRYNWSGWGWLARHLDAWGIDTSQLAGTNDGDIIDDATCKRIGQALEDHYEELLEEGRQEAYAAGQVFDEDHYSSWLKEQPKLWKTCGGYEQW
jgi:hypothetical protein